MEWGRGETSETQYASGSATATDTQIWCNNQQLSCDEFRQYLKSSTSVSKPAVSPSHTPKGMEEFYAPMSYDLFRPNFSASKLEEFTCNTPKRTEEFYTSIPGTSKTSSNPNKRFREQERTPRLSPINLTFPIPGPSKHPQLQSQEISVIQTTPTSRTTLPRSTPIRKGSQFRPAWAEAYSWLHYDETNSSMFCKYCRKWSKHMPDIRTSFAGGNCNFRLEIVNHHDKSKAHRLCVAKDLNMEGERRQTE